MCNPLVVLQRYDSAMLWPLLVPTLGAATYNMAKSSPCPFRFQMATEGGWDIGCFAACVIAAALCASGAPLAMVILLGLPAVAAGTVLLWRHYSTPIMTTGEAAQGRLQGEGAPFRTPP